MDQPKITSVDFHYIKSASYTNYHADGALGGPTPNGSISISFYLERIPIPQKITHEVTQEGALGSETGKEGKSGIIRELECGVMMSVDVAESLAAWLEEQIKKVKTRNNVK